MYRWIINTLFLCLIWLDVCVAQAEYAPVLSWDVCSPSRIVVTLTGGADGGIIYIKGYGSACKQDTTSTETVHEFEFEACGIGKAETYFTIIVQKNPLYQKGDDLQESLLCIYDLSDIAVNNGANVGDKDDDAGINKTVKPTVFMSLYKNGIDISGSDVKLTDLVTMTIQLDEEFLEDFDIKAKSCTANYIEITQNHCPMDTDLFPEFNHVTQGVVTATFGAFRTTDLSGGYVEMVFTCTLTVCRGLCAETVCDNGVGRRKRAADEDIAFEDLNVGTSMSVGTDIDVNPNDSVDDNDVCMDQIAFLITIVTITLALVSSITCTTITSRKLAKKSEKLRKLTSDTEEKEDINSMRNRMERRTSVNVLCTNSASPVIIKSPNSNQTTNADTAVTMATSNSNQDIDEKMITKEPKVSVSTMYTQQQCVQVKMGDTTLKNKDMTSGVTSSRDNQSTNRRPLETISEDDLNQLKQCRDMLHTMNMLKQQGRK